MTDDLLSTPKRRAWSWAGWILLPAAGAALVFAPSGSAPTFFGQENCILRLPALSSWRNIPLIFSHDFMIFSDGLYRPMAYALIALARTFLPAEATGVWHAVLIACHAVNTMLLALVMRRIVKSELSAAVGAAAFCLHPIAATVANNIAYVHLLFGVSFYLGSLWGYLAFRGRGRPALLLLSLGAFAAGVLTSPIVATLLLWLPAYELLDRRQGIRGTALRLLPFAVLTSLAVFLWCRLRPHPLLFSYSAVEGGEWPSFYSIVAGSYWYGSGLFSGYGIPIILPDVMRRVFTPNATFLCWLAAHLLFLGVALWRIARRDPLGLGLLWIYTAMVPFLSTAWNPMEEHVAWVYLYLPTCGLALMIAAVGDKVLSLGARPARIAATLALVLLIGQYGFRLWRINALTRSPVAYWESVVAMDRASENAQVALGKAYLAANDVGRALDHLFMLGVRKLHVSCRAMCLYYTRTGDLQSACVHKNFSRDPRVFAELYRALGIPDYAESALGVALAMNPFDTGGMRMLAEILAEKGYVPAARRWVERALAIDPYDSATRALLQRLDAERDAAPPPFRVRPPRADWLRLLTDMRATARVRTELLALSDRHPNDPILQVAAAHALVEDGQAVAALSKLEKASQSLAFSPFFAELFSHSLTLAGNAEAAATVAGMALQYNPKNGRLHFHLANALMLQQKTAEAVAQYQEAVRLQPDLAEAHCKLGYAYSELGRMGEAIRSYREAVRIKPDLAEAHANLGAALLQQRTLDQAVEHLRRAIQLKPGDPTVRFNLGYAYAEQGQFDKAIESYSDALRLKPDYVDALNNLGGVYLAKGDVASALAQYAKAVQVKPDDGWAHFNMGRALARQGKTVEAAAHLREAVRIHPKDAEAQYALGDVLATQGKFREAVEHISEAHKLQPDALQPANRLAWLLATCPDPALRDGPRAVLLAQAACEMTRQRDPETLGTLAAAYAEAGRFPEAVAAGEHALRLARDHTPRLSGQERSALVQRLRQRLDCYKAGKPFRETR